MGSRGEAINVLFFSQSVSAGGGDRIDSSVRFSNLLSFSAPLVLLFVFVELEIERLRINIDCGENFVFFLFFSENE